MNYFNELQERIREIRLCKRFFYQKIKEIYTDGTPVWFLTNNAKL